jgi:hypothetical protein
MRDWRGGPWGRPETPKRMGDTPKMDDRKRPESPRRMEDRRPEPIRPAPRDLGRSADLEKRLDRLMQELEELRKDIRRR